MNGSESMAESGSTIQRDFDRIALLSGEDWGHNSHYHGFLLRQIPPRCEFSLDVGCGTGAFSRLLADRSERVVALDLSPQMIQVAREHSKGYSNIEFQVADATAWAFPSEQFDCVASIATLHHLPMAATLAKMRDALRAGGALVVLDLYQEKGLADLLTSALAVPVDKAMRLLKLGRLTQPPELRDAWAEHGRHDSYLTLPEIRQLCASVLPGARVKKHLLWRYSITWIKMPVGCAKLLNRRDKSGFLSESVE
jgi:ubiquinone/menaquinone biosynthesis C-methylase UbiE